MWGLCDWAQQLLITIRPSLIWVETIMNKQEIKLITLDCEYKQSSKKYVYAILLFQNRFNNSSNKSTNMHVGHPHP